MRPRADRSWKLSFETRELTGDEVKLLADNFQGQGWLVFKPNEESVSLSEIPDVDAEAGIESPSSRLRKRLWVLWKQRGKRESFDTFYLDQMQKFMEYVESKLEPTN
jgi:hypothetical protein